MFQRVISWSSSVNPECVAVFVECYDVSGEAYTDRDECVCLTWREWFSIILGIARGLAYLHGSNITHYNLKATNMLIDAATWEAKVSDFGLARLLASALVIQPEESLTQSLTQQLAHSKHFHQDTILLPRTYLDSQTCNFPRRWICSI